MTKKEKQELIMKLKNILALLVTTRSDDITEDQFSDIVRKIDVLDNIFKNIMTNTDGHRCESCYHPVKVGEIIPTVEYNGLFRYYGKSKCIYCEK